MNPHDADDPETWFHALLRFFDEGYEAPAPRSSKDESSTRWDER